MFAIYACPVCIWFIYICDYLSIAHHFHFVQELAWPRGRVRWLQHPAVSLSTILMSMMLVISKQKHDEEPASQAEKTLHQFSGTGVQLCAVPLDPLGYFCYKIRNASVPHNQKIIAVTWSKKWSQNKIPKFHVFFWGGCTLWFCRIKWLVVNKECNGRSFDFIVDLFLT